MEKDINLNSAADNYRQAKDAAVRNSIAEEERKSKPGSTSPAAARQQGFYSDGDKAAPDNNPFFTGRSNPLSSKGN